jgi:hypothetical protein
MIDRRADPSDPLARPDPNVVATPRSPSAQEDFDA